MISENLLTDTKLPCLMPSVAATARRFWQRTTSVSKIPSTSFSPENVEAGKVQVAIKAAEGVIAKADTGAVINLPIDQINEFPGLNVRVTGKAWQGRVDEMAADIKAHGYDVAQPLIVFVLREDIPGDDGKAAGKIDLIYLENGHTRFAAVQKAIEAGADIKTLPVIFRPSGWTPRDATRQMIRDNSGEPLSPFEQSVAVARMKNDGMDEDAIAAGIGKTKRYVQDLLVLSEAPAAVRNAVIKGEIAASVAVREIRAAGPDKAAANIGKAVEKAKAAGKNKVTPTALKGKEKATGKAPKKDKPKATKLAPASQDDPLGESDPAMPDTDYLRGALTYAANFGKAVEGIGFIKRFLADDAKAIEELEKFLGQPVGSFKDPVLRKAEVDIGDL